LGAVRRVVGMGLEVRRWILAPGLAAILSGLNASLLLKILRNAGLESLVASGCSLLFGVGQYLLVLRILNEKRIEGKTLKKLS
ncbi:MAG: hypothetical protein IJZ52_05115, partial [Clostridium sp.]|nr:hypothetical protein [Clostridium sp.]